MNKTGNRFAERGIPASGGVNRSNFNRQFLDFHGVPPTEWCKNKNTPAGWITAKIDKLLMFSCSVDSVGWKVIATF